MPDPRENLDIYTDIATGRLAAQVKGKANPYTSMNGKMFSFLDKTGTICLRLGKADRADWADRLGTPPVVQHGAVMKDYVSLPPDAFEDGATLDAICADCLANAKALPKK